MTPPDPTYPGHLRPSWARSERPVPRLVLRPLQAFLATEYSGGILLLVAAAAALVWANSAASAAYEELWRTPVTLRIGTWSVSEDLRHWVNEGLMTLFFFVVGLEIKRELTTGELRDLRMAALPAVAAVGGMVAPALLYLAFNSGGPESRGWGIPVATDIAFALGVLAIVGRRVPSGLKAFLLALAIADDIGAIVVIAVFYSSDVSWVALGVAVALFGALALLHRLNVRWIAVYVVVGVGVWLASFLSGVHATIAGAFLGLLAPARPFQRPVAVSQEAHRVAEETVDDPDPPDADAHHWLRLAELSREAVSPLARLGHGLHPWTSYLIVPLFALANAGVHLRGDALADVFDTNVTIGIVGGLVVGKPLGVCLATWLCIRLGLTTLPPDVTWRQFLGVAALAGIGFTVSLFISDLAIRDPEVREAAKFGILVASVMATVFGAALLWRSGRRVTPLGRPEIPE
ncbi:MAG: Na+/H+ antiporter NhaA [Actinobacteria bacterium]|nr:Na+/H+ antiporter NhaA [Actinomycetota bacterium]